MIRRLAAVVGAASLVVAVASCTSHQTKPAPATATGNASGSIAALPNPSPSDLPVGTRVLFQRDGSGNSALDLTTAAQGQSSVSVDWVCVGNGDLNFVAAGKVVLGGGCAGTAADATVDEGKVPIAAAKSLSWQVQTAPSNRWRLNVTTG